MIDFSERSSVLSGKKLVEHYFKLYLPLSGYYSGMNLPKTDDNASFLISISYDEQFKSFVLKS